MQARTITCYSGFIAKYTIDECGKICSNVINIVSCPAQNTPLYSMINYQDRGGLVYPSRALINLVAAVYQFIIIMKPHIMKNRPKYFLNRILQPYFEQNNNFTCDKFTSDHSVLIRNILIKRILQNLLQNKGRFESDLNSGHYILQHKPLSRKVLKINNK